MCSQLHNLIETNAKITIMKTANLMMGVCAILVLFLLSTFPFKTGIVHVKADIPDVLSVVSWVSGENTILNITVRHASFDSFHFINQVEVDKDGSVQIVTLTSQSTEIFMIQYNLGVVAGIANVRARAHCTVHGFSIWSSPIVIPEFSSMFIPVILVALTIVTLFTRSKLVKLNAY